MAILEVASAITTRANRCSRRVTSLSTAQTPVLRTTCDSTTARQVSRPLAGLLHFYTFLKSNRTTVQTRASKWFISDALVSKSSTASRQSNSSKEKGSGTLFMLQYPYAQKEKGSGTLFMLQYPYAQRKEKGSGTLFMLQYPYAQSTAFTSRRDGLPLS